MTSSWKDKLASGRFWLAIAAGIVFIAGSVAWPWSESGQQPFLDNDQVVNVIMVVFLSYFNRNRSGEGTPK